MVGLTQISCNPLYICVSSALNTHRPSFMKVKLPLLAAVLAITVIIGCGGGTLEGTYVWTPGGNHGASIEFFSDGSCITTIVLFGGAVDKIEGTYTISGDTITKVNSGGKEITYTLSSEAVIIDEEGHKFFKK